MAKVSFTNLKLKVNKETTTFNFNNIPIQVLKYLPVEDKYDLIMITLQKAEEDGIYNEIKLDLYFHLHLVYMYTNIGFTEKQKEDEAKLYDMLMSSGFMNAFLAALDESEYSLLLKDLEIMMERKLKYNTTAAAVVNRFVTDFPRNAKIAADIVDTFDPEQYQRIVQLAQNAGIENSK